MKKYIAVVQVKYHSDQFPGKSLASLGADSALAFLMKRLMSATFLDRIIVATTVDSADDVIVGIARQLDVEVFRGDPKDVIGRLYEAVRQYQPRGIVKILGNAPLVDIDEMRELISLHAAGGYDYAYNEHAGGVIYGMGCSVFSFEALQKLAESAELTSEQREMGSLYVRQHAEAFSILKNNVLRPRPLYKVMLDEPKDIELIKTLVRYVNPITNDTVGAYLDENPLLVEYQKGQGVSETGLEKLFHFPSKISSYIAGGIDLSYPVSVELSLTNRCNFDCIWCSDSALRERLGGEFTIDEMRRLFADLKAGGTSGVVIEGGGEPMIHQDFEEIVKMAADHGLSLGLISNGSIPLAEHLVPYFEWIRISLDAATPEQHTKAKKVQVFEKVMKNIKAIGECKDTTVLGVGYVVTKNNIENLENLLLRLRNYSVNYIQLRPVIDAPDIRPEVDLSYLKKYETSRFRVDINAMTANDVRGNGGVPCVAHSLSSVITADGGVYLCGRLNIYDWVKPIGNLHHASFKEIWHGEERKRQAEMVAGPEFCLEHCPECRMTKYNQLVGRLGKMKTKSFI